MDPMGQYDGTAGETASWWTMMELHQLGSEQDARKTGRRENGGVGW